MRSLSRDSRILQRQLPACTVSSAWDRRFGRYQRRTASNSDGNGSFRCKTKISVELVFPYCRTVVFYLRDGVCRSVDRACYSHEGGYAFIGVSLRVCFLFVYQQDYPKIFNRFSRNSVKKRWHVDHGRNRQIFVVILVRLLLLKGYGVVPT